MRKLRVLDLFCGAGGASEGYVRAGYDVVGVDINPQPNYPYEFIQDDAFSVFQIIVGKFDLIHASPPCQRYSTMTKRWGREEDHPDLIASIRELFFDTPYVIENVIGSPLINPITLCGQMFNLHSGNYYLRRHRLFEINLDILQPLHLKHEGLALSVYGHPGGTSKRDGLKFAQLSDWKIGMGIDWMNIKELSLSIPPAYTEWIGNQVRPMLKLDDV